MSIELFEYDYIPPGFLDCHAKNLHTIIPGPSLISLKGIIEKPLFVCILQHGNEPVGLYAIQRILKSYSNQVLPRSLIIFVSNVEAARKGLRRLDYQPDYNRMWSDSQEERASNLPEAELMLTVLEKVKARKPFASIDLHANSGLNPHYACINKLDNRFYHLASLFSQTVVYFIYPRGVQSIVFAEICPSVTLECGHVDDEAGIEHAFEYIDACLQLKELPETPVPQDSIDLYHTVATVKVTNEFSFSFDDSTKDIYFSPELETYNFKDVEAGSLFAVTHPDKSVTLDVINDEGEGVAHEYFDFSNNEIRMKKVVMPSMLTLDERVVKQDCLCYLMERFPLK